MVTSFFEKLTGASEEEEGLETRKIDTEIKKPRKIKTTAKPSIKKDNKKNSNMPKIKKPTKIEEKLPVENLDEPEEVEEKDWLDEAEGEEGQLTVDVYQTEKDIVVKSTIAGVDPENIDVSITNDMITIRGRRSKDEQVETENYYYQELYWGAFSRSVILPVEVDADKAKASIKNGILTIKIPKTEKAKIKKIKVLAN